MEGQEGDPERSDEERVALWEESGRLSGLGELPGGGGLSQSSLASLPVFPSRLQCFDVRKTPPPPTPGPLLVLSLAAGKGHFLAMLGRETKAAGPDLSRLPSLGFRTFSLLALTTILTPLHPKSRP